MDAREAIKYTKELITSPGGQRDDGSNTLLPTGLACPIGKDNLEETKRLEACFDYVVSLFVCYSSDPDCCSSAAKARATNRVVVITDRF